MRVALDVFSLDKKVEKNKQCILAHIEEASTQGAELVVFPETCVTGLANIGKENYRNTGSASLIFDLVA